MVEQAVYGVYEKGGKPAKYYATDICDGCAQGHDGMNVVLASREAIANMVEVHASAVPWDGIILSSSCDKSIPAHLKAAARMDIPTIFMPGGSMRPGPNMTTSLVAGDISLRQKRKDAITEQEVRDYKLTGCPSVGACTFLGTASTMQCMAEALGLTLPGAALVPATMRDILQYSRYAGRKIMELVEKNITPSQIMTPAAFRNAIIVHSAIGGSTNATIHLPSIARELGYDLPIELFDEINHQVPHLGHQSLRHPADGVLLLPAACPWQWMLRDMLDLDVMTVTGKTLGENLRISEGQLVRPNLGYLANYGLTRDQVIFPVEKAPEKGSVAILKGNIAPEGSVLKYSACAMNQREVVNAVARVFNSEEDAHDAVVENKINPGEVVIIRYEGPRGCGMPEMLMTTEAIVCDERINGSVALITDFCRFSGATRGAAIGHVSSRGCRRRSHRLHRRVRPDLLQRGEPHHQPHRHPRCPLLCGGGHQGPRGALQGRHHPPGAPEGLLQALHRPRPVRYEGRRPGVSTYRTKRHGFRSGSPAPAAGTAPADKFDKLPVSAFHLIWLPPWPQTAGADAVPAQTAAALERMKGYGNQK